MKNTQRQVVVSVLSLQWHSLIWMVRNVQRYTFFDTALKTCLILSSVRISLVSGRLRKMAMTSFDLNWWRQILGRRIDGVFITVSFPVDSFTKSPKGTAFSASLTCDLDEEVRLAVGFDPIIMCTASKCWIVWCEMWMVTVLCTIPYSTKLDIAISNGPCHHNRNGPVWKTWQTHF